MAPEPLDHFKRGYQDRAIERERELHDHHRSYPRHQHQEDRRNTGIITGTNHNHNNGADFGGRNNNNNSNSYPPHRNSYEGGGRGDRGDRTRPFHRSGEGGEGESSFLYSDEHQQQQQQQQRRSSSYLGGGGSGDHRDDRGGGPSGGVRGPTIIMGLDIGALVDRLVRPGCDVFRELDETREDNKAVFQSGKAVTAIISNLARRRNLRIANAVWEWMDGIGIDKNTFHYNSMISVCEKVRDYNKALRLLDEMTDKKVAKNEVTFSSAISACEKCGQWRNALDLLEQMVRTCWNAKDIPVNRQVSYSLFLVAHSRLMGTHAQTFGYCFD
jgi:pentatricopeptide repeat protein